MLKSRLYLSFLSLCIPLSIFSKTVEFTLFTFNDVYDIHPKKEGLGGFSPFYTILENERSKVKNHLTTMNGDFLFPSVYSSIDRGRHRIELFNAMKVDMVVMGNHEFDFGPKVVKERILESDFPWFGANVYDIQGNYFSGDCQTKIYNIEGVKIGFFGLVTNETPIVSSTENSVLFCPLKLTAKRMCEQLKNEGADVIVALTHLFIDEDRQLADEVPEIDVILGGHDHDPVIWYEKETLIMKTGQNAYFLGRLDLKIEVDEKRNIFVYPSCQLIANKNASSHQEIDHLITRYDEHLANYGMKPLTVLETPLDSRHGIIRGGESTMANLITDALREAFDTDIAMMSGGIIRGDRFYGPAEPLTYEDLMKELPFENVNIVIEVLGADILKALENGVALAEHLAGAFPQVSGMEYFFNKCQQPGERIIDVKIDGKPLDLKKKYTVATNTYNQQGGDGYFSFVNSKILVSGEKGGKLIDSVKDYLLKRPLLHLEPDGRIKMISLPNMLDRKKDWMK